MNGRGHGSVGGEAEAIRVKLLGGLRVSVGSRVIEDAQWRLRKPAALMKLLALAPAHRLQREQIMDLLWPDSSKRSASNNLRQTLHTARKILDPVSSTRYLRSDNDSLVLCPGGEIWVDAEAFEEAAATAWRSKDPAAYRAALDLYAGELLPEDRYEEWAQDRREVLRRSYLELLTELAGAHEERGEHGLAIEALRRALAEEPTNEEVHAGLMRLYALSGRQGEALAQYGRLRDLLFRKLGAEPSPATRSLHEQIVTGRFPPARNTPDLPEEPPAIGNHNLPAPRSSFIGRERETLEVKRELAMTRLLTLTGAGGSGKTRLALEVARDLMGAYPDGMRLMELAPLSEGGLVPQAVAGALGLRERPGEPLTDTLAEALETKQMLLVMDNCEHLIDAVARLADGLLDSCPRLRILATSREALGIAGEAVWLVPPLSVPEQTRAPSVEELEGYASARLLVERARLRNPTFTLTSENAEAVAEICRGLEGIPLAIELAAARVGLSAKEIAARLEDSLTLLTGGNRTALPRQQTLRGTLDWSHDLLSGSERGVFRTISVFADGWGLRASEAVGSGKGLAQGEVLDLLSGLMEKSLVVAKGTDQGSMRYRMLEPIRQYALEKLEQSGESEATKRSHARYFLAVAEEAEPELIGSREAEWFDRLEEELDNIRAALSWAQARGESELGLRLAGALMWFWLREGLHSEGRRWLEGALAEEGSTSAVARAKAIGAASLLAWAQGDLDRAREAAEEGLGLCKETGREGNRAPFFVWGSPEAFFLSLLAYVSSTEGDLERTAKLGEEMLTLNRQADDMQGIVGSLIILGMAATDRGDYEQAEEFYAEGLSLARELGSEYLRFLYLAEWGWESVLHGDHKRATELTEEAVELARGGVGIGVLQRALDTLGKAALLGADLERAKALFEESLTLSKEVGDKEAVSVSLEGMACVAAAEGESEKAVRLFGAAWVLMDVIGHRPVPQKIAMREPYLGSVRSRLGKAAWDEAMEEGKAMGLDEAIEYAFSEEPTTNPPPTPRQQLAHKPPNLTRREREVAALVSEGLTNRQIASELVISERTVDHQVASILKKLGLHSREQVASRLGDC